MKLPWWLTGGVTLLVGCSAGCDSISHPTLLVPEGHTAQAFQQAYTQSGTPATEEAAKRTLRVAQRIYDSNTQMPVQPTIFTIGRPEKAVFHEGYGGLSGSRVYITEGLINACKTDDQLAAVLCVQFGKIMAERAERSGAKEEDTGRLSIDERIGREIDRGFGPADGTRMMEIAKRQKMARERKLRADPTRCAETYLRRANYDLQALLEVSAMMLQIESNEEEMREIVSPRPPKGQSRTLPNSHDMPPAPPVGEPALPTLQQPLSAAQAPSRPQP
ncbi:MAG: hypothetical protein SNJ82_11880 [Gemmataceae bacterium]